MALQIDHDLMNMALGLPGLLDGLQPFGPQPFHLQQAIGFVIEDVEGFEPKGLDNPGRQAGTHPFDQPGAQITLDAGQGMGLDQLIVLNLELAAKSGILNPGAGKEQIRPYRHPG